MLILQRKAGESLLIGDQIKVTVVSVEAGGRVRLAIDAPRSMTILRSELRRAVVRGLDQLPDDARRILILRELDGLSYAEIGKVLRLEPGTVKSRLFRARRRLCEFLRDDGNLPDRYASKQTKGGADV